MRCGNTLPYKQYGLCRLKEKAWQSAYRYPYPHCCLWKTRRSTWKRLCSTTSANSRDSPRRTRSAAICWRTISSVSASGNSATATWSMPTGAPDEPWGFPTESGRGRGTEGENTKSRAGRPCSLMPQTRQPRRTQTLHSQLPTCHLPRKDSIPHTQSQNTHNTAGSQGRVPPHSEGAVSSWRAGYHPHPDPGVRQDPGCSIAHQTQGG